MDVCNHRDHVGVCNTTDTQTIRTYDQSPIPPAVVRGSTLAHPVPYILSPHDVPNSSRPSHKHPAHTSTPRIDTSSHASTRLSSSHQRKKQSRATNASDAPGHGHRKIANSKSHTPYVHASSQQANSAEPPSVLLTVSHRRNRHRTNLRQQSCRPPAPPPAPPPAAQPTQSPDRRTNATTINGSQHH